MHPATIKQMTHMSAPNNRQQVFNSRHQHVTSATEQYKGVCMFFPFFIISWLYYIRILQCNTEEKDPHEHGKRQSHSQTEASFDKAELQKPHNNTYILERTNAATSLSQPEEATKYRPNLFADCTQKNKSHYQDGRST